MEGIPIWLQVALIVCLVASLGTAIFLQVRGTKDDDGLGWKVLAAVAIPSTLLLTVAITMLASGKKGGGSDNPVTPPTPANNPIDRHDDEDAIAHRESMVEGAEDRASHIEDDATDDEVASRGASLFDPGKPSG